MTVFSYRVYALSPAETKTAAIALQDDGAVLWISPTFNRRLLPVPVLGGRRKRHHQGGRFAGLRARAAANWGAMF